jgi:hypothetical protein
MQSLQIVQSLAGVVFSTHIKIICSMWYFCNCTLRNYLHGCRVLLEKLTVSQLVEKFSAFISPNVYYCVHRNLPLHLILSNLQVSDIWNIFLMLWFLWQGAVISIPIPWSWRTVRCLPLLIQCIFGLPPNELQGLKSGVAQKSLFVTPTSCFKNKRKWRLPLCLVCINVSLNYSACVYRFAVLTSLHVHCIVQYFSTCFTSRN